MGKGVFFARISDEGRQFLEETYDKAKKKVKENPGDYTPEGWNARKVTRSFSAFVISLALRQAKADNPPPPTPLEDIIEKSKGRKKRVVSKRRTRKG